MKLIPLTQLNQQRQGLGPSYSKQSSWMDLNELLTTSGPSSLSPFSQGTQPGSAMSVQACKFPRLPSGAYISNNSHNKLYSTPFTPKHRYAITCIRLPFTEDKSSPHFPLITVAATHDTVPVGGSLPDTSTSVLLPKRKCCHDAFLYPLQSNTSDFKITSN